MGGKIFFGAQFDNFFGAQFDYLFAFNSITKNLSLVLNSIPFSASRAQFDNSEKLIILDMELPEFQFEIH